MIKKVKDKLFFRLVEKHPDVLKEYQAYKWAIEGRENKFKSWSYILLLNTKYRLLKIGSVNKRSIEYKKSNTARNVKRGPRLPYLDGSESMLLNRPDPIIFAKRLLNYDIVSFDIFDTLILRPFAQPHHLFMILAEKFDIVDFMSIRKEAEKEARLIARQTKGNNEVTIYDIYKIIERKTGLNKEYGVNVEFETELSLCSANPYFKEVFNFLATQNKRIIAVSDMYLTRSMIEQLLTACGYTGFEEIYVSSENNASKRDKNLYTIVKHKYGTHSSIVHVGDNYQTDIIHAKEMGISAEYYKNVHEAGNQYRSDGMSDLIGSAYSGIVNTHLHNGVKQYSPYYEYGFIYGGLYVLGYCNWIYDYVKKNNIDKILFLSRDGHIYKKVFDYLFDDVENEYVYWSRIANIKYTIEKDRESFLNRMVFQKSYVNNITIGGLFESLRLEELLDLLNEYDLKADDIIHSGNSRLLEDFLIDHWDLVQTLMLKDIEVVRDYFVDVIGDSKNIAIVDVGWIGTGASGIRYLIKDKWKLNVEKVHSLLAASRHWNHSAHLYQFHNKSAEVYMFSRMHNRILYDVHSNTNKNTNNVYFEFFTQACSPSFAGFEKSDQGYKFLFDIPEVENYSIVREIHHGILDFVKKYTKTFKEYPYLFNISGYDAYLPFRMIIRDLSFFKKYFGDFRFNRGVLIDTENQNLESLRDILAKRKL